MSKNPIERVRAKGDAFSIGVAIGQATAPTSFERGFRTEYYQALDAYWRGSDYVKNLEAAARATYPQYVREIEGIAAGSGQDFETIFLKICDADLPLPENVPRR
ncbi:hypothetical protein AB0V79_25040 [Mesorhizobium ciceri]|uniref:hypothetical protein n=1 Tax=Mesorhizobium TaxID=68287 RepID=UPI000A783685|nr:hypothetical protein [Mesorhizobium ciceri]